MKKYYRLVAILLLLSAIVIVAVAFACKQKNEGQSSSSIGDDTEQTYPMATTKVYSVPNGVDLYGGAELYVNGEEVPLYRTKYNQEQVWSAEASNRKDTGFAYFDFDGEVEIKIVYATEQYKAFLVRPSAYKVFPKYNESENSVTFTLKHADNYVVEPVQNCKQVIYLFCNQIEEPEFTPTDSNVIYFEAGLHTAQNDSRIGANNVLRVYSGQTVYLADGAVLRCKIQGDNVSNVRITGRGIIDGSTFERNPNKGTVTVPIEFNRCNNVTVENVVLNDPAGWCVQYYFVTDGKIDNVRILSSRSNGDGVSLQSCQNIEVSRVFARTWDDCLVVKNYPLWSNRAQHGTTKNITFEYCTLWADLAQCMEVGYETVGAIMEDITFNNVTVLHAMHKPVMSIHNGNNANVKRVKFTNITVEDASMGLGDAGSNRQLLDITVAYSPTWSDGHTVTSLGSVDGVTVFNVWVYSAKTPIEYRIIGSQDKRSAYFGSAHFAKNVTITGVKVGTVVQTEDSAKITVNEYSSAIKFEQLPSSQITGAQVYGLESRV